MRDPLDKGRFSGAEIPLQADYIPWLQRSAKSHTDSARLFRAAAEKIHSM